MVCKLINLARGKLPTYMDYKKASCANTSIKNRVSEARNEQKFHIVSLRNRRCLQTNAKSFVFHSVECKNFRRTQLNYRPLSAKCIDNKISV